MSYCHEVGDINELVVLEQELGSGSYGRVYRGKLRSQARKIADLAKAPSRVAVKENRKELTQHEAAKLVDEVKIIKLLRHKNIVRVYGCAHYPNEAKLYIISELIDGLDLYDHLRQHQLTRADKIRLTRQLINATRHMHRKGVYHRDLKTENLMVTKGGHLKVIDFGLSCADPDDQKLGVCGGRAGTRGYMPYKTRYPESVEEYEENDWWAVIIVIFKIWLRNCPIIACSRNSIDRSDPQEYDLNPDLNEVDIPNLELFQKYFKAHYKTVTKNYVKYTNRESAYREQLEYRKQLINRFARLKN